MKLRNKKTGKIVIVEFISDYQTDDGTEIGFRVKNTLNYYSYSSLAEFNEEWEDYKPKESLIKNEKIRKAVRAWAEANRDVRAVIYGYDTNKVYCELIDTESEARIRFNFLFINELNTYNIYTIHELCGENE